MPVAFLVAMLATLAGRAEAAGDTPSCTQDRDPALVPSEERGPCEEPPGSASVEGRSSEGPFTVSVAGPRGSGRYWDARVSFSTPAGVAGFCLVTTTVGWRHVAGDALLARSLVALLGSWVRDTDGDGRDELIVPSSFPLSPDAALYDHAMTASVYERAGERFVFDAARTRSLRHRVARAYRARASSSDHPPDPEDRAHFRRAALLLERSCPGHRAGVGRQPSLERSGFGRATRVE